MLAAAAFNGYKRFTEKNTPPSFSNEMPTLRDRITNLTSTFPARPSSRFGYALAEALSWSEGETRAEPLSLPEFDCTVTELFLGEQPAMLFFGHHHRHAASLLPNAARFAYHTTVEWGLVTNSLETIVFNSHWVHGDKWFSLPALSRDDLVKHIPLLESLAPDGLMHGSIDRMALEVRKPDHYLAPVDDALVNRLDWWRSETMRHSRITEKVDAHLHTLFAQLFVLRAVEDRRLAPSLPPLRTALRNDDADPVTLREIFSKAKSFIQSDLFEVPLPDGVPSFVLGGIIRDLYYPIHLPIKGIEYNFAWIHADVLGRAYEKYLSTVLIPSRSTNAQLQFWNQPLREVERVSQQKASGVYYTPAFIVRYLSQRCLREHFQAADSQNPPLPRIADIACGSGSFLVAAADAAIRFLRELDDQRNWGRELIANNCLVGLDIDPRAVTLAQLSLWLRLAEEPDPLPLPDVKKSVVCGDSLRPETWATLPTEFDIILGNPPFMAIGDLPSRKELAAQFVSAQGRFDYSYIFVEQCIRKLREGGWIGLVIPNRLYRNRDAAAVRELLGNTCRLHTLIDFGSTEIFPGISTYIALLVASRGTAAETPTRYIEVRNLPPRFAGGLLNRVDKPGREVEDREIIAFDVSAPVGRNPWLLLSPRERRTRIQLSELSVELSSIAGLFQGIKTGANDIFIVSLESAPGEALWHISNGMGDVAFVEPDLLRPVVFGSDIQRYDAVRPRSFLVYPYEAGRVVSEAELTARFPRLYNYLCRYKELLEGRNTILRSGTGWYELAWKRDEAWLSAKKLVMRDLAPRPAFAFDDTGSTFLVGGTAVVPTDELVITALLAYLNSRVAGWYLSRTTPAFRAGFQKIEPQHLSQLPVPRLVVEGDGIRDELSVLAGRAVAATISAQEALLRETERLIDELLGKSLGINLREMR
jgi:SAM-dependent methyltransferase